MKFLALMFSEPGGSPSSMRLLACLVTSCVVGTWTAVSLQKRELQPLAPETTMLVLGSLGMKAWQRGKERGESGDTKFVARQAGS